MEDKLIARLEQLGYTYDPEKDHGMLEFCMNASANVVKHRINRDEIPDGLEYVYIDMVCGEFLKLKKSCGQLINFQFERIVESVKEGDTQVTFQKDMTPEQQFDAMLVQLTMGHEEDFIRYRRLVW